MASSVIYLHSEQHKHPDPKLEPLEDITTSGKDRSHDGTQRV